VAADNLMKYLKYAVSIVLYLGGVLDVPLANAAPTSAQIAQQIGTVFVIAMENHNFTQPTPTSSPQQLLNNPAAPYFNSLITAGNSNAAHVSYATKYYNAGNGVHPSEPNYIWAEAGTDFGIRVDNDPSAGSSNIFSMPHLTAQMNTAGISWRNYEEDVQLSSGPGVSASGTSGTVINPYYHTGQYGYAAKHNPMVFFSDTATQNVRALTNLAADLTNNSVARYNWISPNLYNDQHTGLSGGYTYHGTTYSNDQAAVAQGDNFLSIVVPQITASTAWQNNGVIIIRWDETEGGDSTSYTIPEIIISPLAKGNAYASSVVMSHSSDIKTIEEMLGFSFLSNAIPASETAATGSGYNNVATVNDLTDMFQAEPVLNAQEPVGHSLTNGVSMVNFGAAYIGAWVTNTFTITNSGIGMLMVTNMGFTGANPGDFAVSGITLPASILTNGTATFLVAFSPAAASGCSAMLQITNNDPMRSPFTIKLAGTGNSNAAPVLSDNGTLTANGFQLTFTANIGQHYRVLGSSDPTQPLTNWTVMASGTVASNPVTYTDTDVATNGARFFCIVSP
jgi:hypothetical protein